MNENEKVKMTIKLDKKMKDKIVKYQQFGYSKNEIITMGLILLEDSKNFEILLKNKKLEEKTINEMIELNKSIEQLNKRIDKIKYENDDCKLQEILTKIIEDEIIPREQIVYYLHVKPEKLKKEYFERISEETGVP
ncbi:MAG: hypothetical protein VZQ62_08255, partial [Methanosphaera sp.]|nr:hypothetical protein [Methanosphaera sp.]